MISDKKQRKLCLLHLRKEQQPHFPNLAQTSSVPNYHFSTEDNAEPTKPNMAFRKNSAKFSYNVLKDLRWIVSWNLWIDTTKLIIHSFIANQTRQNKKCRTVVDEAVAAHESCASNKTATWKRFGKYLARRSTGDDDDADALSMIKNIDKLCTLVDVWEMTHRRSVTLLSFIQITTCEHKTKLKKLRLDELLQLELIQVKFLHQITRMNTIIEKYHQNLETWVNEYANDFRVDDCHDSFISRILGKVYDFQQLKVRQFDEPVPATAATTLTDENTRELNADDDHNKKTTAESTQVYEFHEELFIGRVVSSVNCSRFGKFRHGFVNSQNMTEGIQFKYTHMIEIGIEWFMGWIQFTESIQINPLLANKDSAKFLPSPKSVWKQAVQLKVMHGVVTKLGTGTGTGTPNENGAQTKSTTLLETYKLYLELFKQFITFMEMLKSDIISWLQYSKSMNLDLSKISNKSADEIKKVIMIIETKQQMLLQSIQYLYKEILFFIQYIHVYLVHLKSAALSSSLFKSRTTLQVPSTDHDELASLLALLRERYKDLIVQHNIGRDDEDDDDDAALANRNNNERPSFPLIHSVSFELIISKKSRLVLQKKCCSVSQLTNFDCVNSTEPQKVDYWSLILLDSIEVLMEKRCLDDAASSDLLKRSHSDTQSTSGTSWFVRTGQALRNFHTSIRKRTTFSKSVTAIKKKSKSKF